MKRVEMVAKFTKCKMCGEPGVLVRRGVPVTRCAKCIEAIEADVQRNKRMGTRNKHPKKS